MKDLLEVAEATYRPKAFWFAVIIPNYCLLTVINKALELIGFGKNRF
jgi:hypothetical protein